MRISNSIRRALAAALAVLMLLPMAVSADGTAFSDVPEDHPFYAAVMDCAAKGITSGYADGTFKPANSVTKAQFCVMLSRAFSVGNFTLNIHTADNMTILSVTMCSLVLIHKVHIDGIIRNLTIILCMQVQ